MGKSSRDATFPQFSSLIFFFFSAQELVMAARGKLVERNWKHSDDSPATIDDISVFAIPILPYKAEYAEWKVSKKSSQVTTNHSNGLEETGNVMLANAITEEMDIDPAEEVTVSDVSLTIKDDEEEDDSVVNDEEETEEEEEAQK